MLLLAALVGSVVLAIRGKQDAEDNKGQKQIGDNNAAGEKKKTK